MTFSKADRLLMTHAFQRAWLQLLRHERVTVSNIERVPTLLMEAIVDSAHDGERDELLLAQAALNRMAAYERDELEDSLRTFRPLH